MKPWSFRTHETKYGNICLNLYSDNQKSYINIYLGKKCLPQGLINLKDFKLIKAHLKNNPDKYKVYSGKVENNFLIKKL